MTEIMGLKKDGVSIVLIQDDDGSFSWRAERDGKPIPLDTREQIGAFPRHLADIGHAMVAVAQKLSS